MKKKKRVKIRVKNLKRFILTLTFMTIFFVCGILIIGEFYTSKNIQISAVPIKKEEVKLSKDYDNNSKRDSVVKGDKVVKNSTSLSNNEVKNKNNFQDYKSFFKDSIFLGDSITDSLSFYEFLDEKNVIATIGLSILKAKDKTDEVIEKNPKEIFILLGNNDLGNDINTTIKNYSDLVRNLKMRLPSTKIYIQSILPVTEKAAKKQSILSKKNISDFNGYIKDMAKNEGVKYIDLNPIFENMDKGLYEPDGVHFKAGFYNLWLDYLKDNIK